MLLLVAAATAVALDPAAVLSVLPLVAIAHLNRKHDTVIKVVGRWPPLAADTADPAAIIATFRHLSSVHPPISATIATTFAIGAASPASGVDAPAFPTANTAKVYDIANSKNLTVYLNAVKLIPYKELTWAIPP